MSERRIGVFICHCGGNISDYVDVERVVVVAAAAPRRPAARRRRPALRGAPRGPRPVPSLAGQDRRHPGRDRAGPHLSRPHHSRRARGLRQRVPEAR